MRFPSIFDILLLFTGRIVSWSLSGTAAADTTIGAKPEVTLAVLGDSVDAVVSQSVLGAEGASVGPIVAGDTTGAKDDSAKPEVAIRDLEDSLNAVISQCVLGGEGSPIVATDTVCGAKPKVTGLS